MSLFCETVSAESSKAELYMRQAVQTAYYARNAAGGDYMTACARVRFSMFLLIIALLNTVETNNRGLTFCFFIVFDDGYATTIINQKGTLQAKGLDDVTL